jgi:hypothetical protein
MSTLKVSQIKNRLRQKFEAHLDLSDVPAQDKEREPKILSRCLAALAVQITCACSDVDAAKSVWDGSDDNGIDAAYFDTAEARVVLVQSKWISKGLGEPEAKDIGAFTKGVWDIVEQDTTTFHPRLQGRLADIMLRMGTPGISAHVVVVSTGAQDLSQHGTAVLEKLLKELNGDDPNQIATAAVMGLDTVYNGLTSDAGAAHVSLDAQLFDWSYVPAPFPAYFGLIDGLQLKAWWKQHARRLVAANIRHALGATDVNSQIRLTATTAPESFWYFNNGITVVAESAAKAPAGAASRTAGNFTFTGASIVNGAQTVSSLGGIDDDESLGKIRVSIRVIVLESALDEFGKDVTRTNNLQNRIEPRDFAAQDPEQTRLRQEMSMEGVDYLFVRSEEAASTALSCELLEVTTALACAAGDSNLAVQVKTGLGRFFNDLTKPPYKALFNPSTTGARAFNATLVQRAIDEWIDSKRKSLLKKSGPTWGVLVHGNRILAALAFRALGPAILAQPIQHFQSSFKPESLAPILEKALAKSVAAIKKHFDGRHLAVLFKNPSASKQVFDLAAK